MIETVPPDPLDDRVDFRNTLWSVRGCAKENSSNDNNEHGNSNSDSEAIAIKAMDNNGQQHTPTTHVS